MRWEIRLHGWGSGQFPSGSPIVLPGSVSLSAYAMSKFQAGGNTQDIVFNNGPVIENCCAGHSDILVRVQRDVANNQYTLEIHDTDGTFYASAENPILSYGPANWAGTGLSISAGVQVAWIQWYSSVVPLGTPIPADGSATGDLGSWKFNGSAGDLVSDSSANLGGSFNHSANNLTGGTVTSSMTPRYYPRCNAGSQQTLRVGYTGMLSGMGSEALDGNSDLLYFWQQSSGPASVTWSDPTAAQPVITAPVFGTYVFQLTVTDGSGQSSTCTVKDGAVATDDAGVVITDNPAVNTLLGPLIRWGANPWPWYDNRHKAAADVQIANMDTYYSEYWNTSSPGTVTVTSGSTQVVGVETTFQKTFCGGGTTYAGTAIIVWYPTGVTGQTGRREITPATCLDDTHMTLSAPWSGDVAGGSGLTYSINDFSHAWDYQNGPANFYDNVAAFYNLYYRSGIDDYLNAARKLADRYWASPNIDQGTACNLYGYSAYCPGFIYRVTLGLVLRAFDGRPDLWAGLHNLWTLDHFYISSYYPSLQIPGIPDARSNAYLLMDLSYCAMYDPDVNYQAMCAADLSGSLTTLWTPAQQPDGGFPQLYVGTTGGPGFNSSWYTGGSTAAILTNGSPIATGTGNPWTSTMFTDCIGQGVIGCPIWFTNSPSQIPSIFGGGDSRVYYATFIDANHLLLHDVAGNETTYQGVDGIHGWASGDSGTVSTVGWESQPYAMGLLAFGFHLAAVALDSSDPASSALYRSYSASAAKWISTVGYSTKQEGLYYMSGFPTCVPPMADGIPGCVTTTESARVLNAEAIRGLVAAYINCGDQDLRQLIDTMYSAMWSKPGTGGPSPDGTYITAMDDTGFYMTGSPPIGQSPKYFGQFFGVTSLSDWPAIRIRK
jgi:hypothetical protein